VRYGDVAAVLLYHSSLDARILSAYGRVPANVRAVVVTGDGRAFCAGADLSAGRETFDFARRGGAEAAERRDGGGRVSLAIYASKKPVIAAVNGAAVGVGVTMTLPMDIRIASTEARFALREVTAGLSGPLPFVYSIGRPRALFMAMTGAWVAAAQAEQWGLIYKCAAPAELDAEVDAVVQMLEGLPPLAVAATKEKMAFTLSQMGLQSVVDYGFRQDLFLHTTQDRKEAQAAFLEKRKPVFKGR